MSDHNQSNLHKEFELERMILFSDAVFAIAITLLIIEIKFPELPENYKEHLDLFHMFKHTLVEFMGFALSFFFIGVSWARHLKMFRYLRAYDNKVIALNLLSLFFIVAFPFAANGITHITPYFVFPMVIYMGNVMFIFLSNLLLAHYIFKKNPGLTFPGFDAEKKYIYMQNLAFAIGLTVTFTVLLVTAIVSHFDSQSMNISLYSVILVPFINRVWLKKYKPKKPVLIKE